MNVLINFIEGYYTTSRGGRVGGGRVGEKKKKLMLYSTQLKLKLKLELSLAIQLDFIGPFFTPHFMIF